LKFEQLFHLNKKNKNKIFKRSKFKKIKIKKKNKKIFDFEWKEVTFLGLIIHYDLILKVPGSIYQPKEKFSLHSFFSKKKKKLSDYIIFFILILISYFYLFLLMEILYTDLIELESLLHNDKDFFNNLFQSILNNSTSISKKFFLLNFYLNSILIDLINFNKYL
jgi:hypothetical protein